MEATVLTTAWTMEPKAALDFMRVPAAATATGGKNKKKKAKKVVSTAEVNVEEMADEMMLAAIKGLKETVIEQEVGADQREWAAKSFDDKLICALPTILNKRQFKKLGTKQSIAKIERIYKHLHKLLSIKNRVKAKEICVEAIVYAFDGLVADKPCAFVRVAFETAMFVQADHNEHVFFGEEFFSAYLRREVFHLHPFIRNFEQEQCWIEFYEKYLLMSKEYLLSCLRNPSRQHRRAKMFCKDMQMLTAEANYCDETIITTHNIQLQKHYTVSLIMTIRMTLSSMLRYLNHVFTLEMARVEELPALTTYCSYIYQVCCMNQEPNAYSHVMDMNKAGLRINLEDMPNAHPAFKQRRGDFPPELKLYFDQIDYFVALHEIFKGIRRFS